MNAGVVVHGFVAGVVDPATAAIGCCIVVNRRGVIQRQAACGGVAGPATARSAVVMNAGIVIQDGDTLVEDASAVSRSSVVVDRRRVVQREAGSRIIADPAGVDRCIGMDAGVVVQDHDTAVVDAAPAGRRSVVVNA